MGTNIAYYVVTVISLLSVVIFVKAEVDCNARPKFVDHKKCCPVPNLIGEELMETCKGQFGGPPGPPPSDDMADNGTTPPPRGGPHHHHGPHGHHGHHGHHHHCFASCIFNETGILIDSQLDEGNLDTYLNEAAADTADIIPVLKESFQFCYEKSEEIVEKIKDRFAKRGNNHPGHGPPHGHHHHCPPQAGIMFGCAMMKTFQECPDSIWTGSDECNEAREYFNECMHVHEEENDTENEIDDYYENEE